MLHTPHLRANHKQELYCVQIEWKRDKGLGPKYFQFFLIYKLKLAEAFGVREQQIKGSILPIK